MLEGQDCYYKWGKLIADLFQVWLRCLGMAKDQLVLANLFKTGRHTLLETSPLMKHRKWPMRTSQAFFIPTETYRPFLVLEDGFA